MLYGNHDYHSIHYDGIDIATSIKNSRYDIVPLGYGSVNLHLKGDFINIYHNLSVVSNRQLDYSKISFVGHGHEMKTKVYDKLYICVPSLSNVNPDKTQINVPGFIDLSIEFNKTKMEYIKLKHLIVLNDVYECTQTRCRIDDLFNKEKVLEKSK